MQPKISLLLIGVLFLVGGNLYGQSFDEKFDLWPVDLKIQGTIIACGGGEVPNDAINLVKRAASRKDSKTVVLRFAGATNLTAAKVAELLGEPEGLTQYEIESDQTDVPLGADAAIENANAVWVVTKKRITKSQQSALKRVLKSTKKMVANGGLACVEGPSAESLGEFVAASFGDLVTIQSGSHLVPDAVIMSDYSDTEDRGELLSVLASEPQSVGIGIESNTAIVLRNRKIRVVGDGRATFCLMANEEKPLRVLHVKQSRSRRANPYQTIVDLTAWRRDAIERTVEPFPSADPPTPHVENGTLIIVGGGGMPRGLMSRLVELAGGEEAKLVYVPCSEADEISGRQRTVETWKRMGVKSATFIHTKDRNKANSDSQFLAPLKDATGIWFGGGRQWNFADSYYGTEAHRLMKDVLKRGGVIGGSSAGASIQAAYMCRANPVANFDIMAPGYERGLGFIRGVAIDQHFSQRGRQKDMTQLVDRYPQLLGIGLDEATAIVVEKSRAEVVGRGKVHFYNRNEPVIPGTDDFLALEAGAVFDLEKRKVVETETEE